MNAKEPSPKQGDYAKLLDEWKQIVFPDLPENPAQKIWYRICPAGAITANAQPYHAGIRFGTENKLLFLFHGGGMSWNSYMAARPIRLTNFEDPNTFYYEDMGPIADATTPSGIADMDNPGNPFRDWTILSFPYSTGDFHCGTADYPYTDINGQPAVVHHHGFRNFLAVMDSIMPYLPSPDQVLVSGFSAGGFGAAMLTETIVSAFPSCSDFTCLVDSSLMLYDGWAKTAEQIWHVPAGIRDNFRSVNPVRDCFLSIRQKQLPVRLLFCCSPRDNELIRISHYAIHGAYGFSEDVTARFQEEVERFCLQMTGIPNSFFFLFDTPAGQVAAEDRDKYRLTRHTLIHSPKAYQVRSEGKTVMEWIQLCVSGYGESIGLSLLQEIYE